MSRADLNGLRPPTIIFSDLSEKVQHHEKLTKKGGGLLTVEKISKNGGLFKKQFEFHGMFVSKTWYSIFGKKNKQFEHEGCDWLV